MIDTANGIVDVGDVVAFPGRNGFIVGTIQFIRITRALRPVGEPRTRYCIAVKRHGKPAGYDRWGDTSYIRNPARLIKVVNPEAW